MADYGAMTAEQLAAERKRLSEAALGLQGLQRTIPSPDVGEYGTTGLVSQMAPDVRETNLAAQKLQEEKAAVDAAIAALEQQKAEEAAKARVAAAIGEAPPKTAVPAPPTPGPSIADLAQAKPWGGIPYLPGQGPSQAAQTEEFKTIIASRRTPEGRIVFETQRVPLGQAAAPDQGVQDWKARALAENAQRAAATAAYPGVSASGQLPQPFTVQAGEGGYSPSRNVEDVLKRFNAPEVGALTEAQLQQESPAVQDLLRGAQEQDLRRQMQQAALREAQTRGRISETQARLGEEQLARLVDPTIEPRERFALREEAKRRLLFEKRDQIEQQIGVAIDALKAAGQPVPPQMEALIRSSITDKLAGDQALDTMIAQAMSSQPGVAAARFRAGAGFFG